MKKKRKGEEKLRGERRWVGSKGREKREEGRGGRRLGEGKGTRRWGRGCRRPEEEHRDSWGFMILGWTVGGPDAMGDEKTGAAHQAGGTALIACVGSAGMSQTWTGRVKA